MSDKARRIWLHWKRVRSQIDDWRAPPEEEVAADVRAWFARHFGGPGAARHGGATQEASGGGTVHVAAIDGRGDFACCTSTSGHAFKLPGRVGDSPILGAGLYADNGAGSCGSIGHGEANLENLTSFAAVELMRSGNSPQEAGLATLRRIVDKTRVDQKDEQGRPKFNLWLYLLGKDGTHGGVSMWGPAQFALADERGARLEPCVTLFAR